MKRIKILIIGTVPYKKNGPSRSFETYFSSFDNDCLAQIFSNPSSPVKGHCSTLFQITDRMLLEKFFNHKKDVGNIFLRSELYEEEHNYETGGLYDVLKNYKTPFTRLLRKMLWSFKRWHSKKLDNWLEEFKPNCIALSFSNDFFPLEIALYVSKKFNIPIVPIIGDDYYFDDRLSISPFYYIYRKKYKAIVKQIFSRGKIGIYISDKIKNKYCEFFNSLGETIYLSTNMQYRKAFTPINATNPIISYFGNVQCDRYKSIIELSKIFQKVNPKFRINVYSGDCNNRIKRKFLKNEGIVFHGKISYEEVVSKMRNTDILLLVEGFTRKNILLTKYSLSTKVTDSLASGCNLLAYGSAECGMIDYLIHENACLTCLSKETAASKIGDFIIDERSQLFFYKNSETVLNKNHDSLTNINLAKRVFFNAVSLWGQKE